MRCGGGWPKPNGKVLFWIILALVVGIIISELIGCTTYRLERNLDRGIKDWYELHVVLMETKVPWWIDESTPSERLYFLRLPPKLQIKYIATFWEMRLGGADELFYSRVEAANEAFDGESYIGWRTDRGRVLVLCGEPTFIQWYYRGQVSLPTDGMLNGGYRQVWFYYEPRQATYIFDYFPPNSWRSSMDMGLADTSNQTNLEKYWRELLAPTEDGWSQWWGIAKDYYDKH